MNANNIKLYKLLKNDLQMAENKAGEFVDVLDAIIQSDIKDSAMEYKSFVKEDLAEIDKRLDKLDAKIDKVDAKVDKVDAKIDLRISELRGDLRGEIKETKIDTIKWMVGIFLALALMVIGLYFKK
jgi:peptidoglycan hydrolase CwlO-like protein